MESRVTSGLGGERVENTATVSQVKRFLRWILILINCWCAHLVVFAARSFSAGLHPNAGPIALASRAGSSTLSRGHCTSMIRLSFTVLFFVTGTMFGAAPLEFAGYVSTQTSSRFVLREMNSGAVSTWLEIGQGFRGYRIVSFDAKDEVLDLERDGARTMLSLIHARTEPKVLGRFGTELEPENHWTRRINVLGAVKNPGALKPAGRRTVHEAIEAAGGPTGDAQLDRVSVARPVTATRDGEKRSTVRLSFLDLTKPSDREFVLAVGDTVRVGTATKE